MLKRNVLVLTMAGLMLFASTPVFAFEKADDPNYPYDTEILYPEYEFKEDDTIDATLKKNALETMLLNKLSSADTLEKLEDVMLVTTQDRQVYYSLRGERYDEVIALTLQKLTGIEGISFKDKNRAQTYLDYLKLRYPNVLTKLDTLEKDDILDNWLNCNIFTIFVK